MTSLCLHASSQRLTVYFYGELPADERRALDDHIQSCDACAAALEELRLLRSALAPRADAARTPAEWEAFMQRLMPRLQAPTSSTHDVSERAPRREAGGWRALAVAAALLLAVGSGLIWQRHTLGPTRTATSGETTDDAALSAAAERHFERAKLVVLGIAMKDPAETTAADWEYERQLAASLLPETRLFRLSAADQGDTRLASLLGDLENVLLQASMTADADPTELQRLQRAIRRRDLLVRMDLREL